MPGKVMIRSFRLYTAHTAMIQPSTFWKRVRYRRNQRMWMAKIVKNAVEMPMKNAEIFISKAKIAILSENTSAGVTKITIFTF